MQSSTDRTRYNFSAKRLSILAGLACITGVAGAQPVLPDYTQFTFDNTSATVTNSRFALTPGWLSIYGGDVDDVYEYIKSQVTDDTVNILGIDCRVVIDREWEDGLLTEITHDWFAQDTAGNVWYLGEDVINFNYDDNGVFIDTDDDGSWIADGVTNFPGVVMWDDPMVGDEYYQEFAPGVALDFAHVNSLDDTVDTGFGSFIDVLNTGEGNLIDGPEIAENKLYAEGPGLVLIQELDKNGDVEFEIELLHQLFVPAPAAAGLFALGTLVLTQRKRG